MRLVGARDMNESLGHGVATTESTEIFFAAARLYTVARAVVVVTMTEATMDPGARVMRTMVEALTPLAMRSVRMASMNPSNVV